MTGKYEFLADKLAADFRHSKEFAAKIRPAYTMAELDRMDYLVFIQLLDECREELQSQIDKAKQKD